MIEKPFRQPLTDDGRKLLEARYIGRVKGFSWLGFYIGALVLLIPSVAIMMYKNEIARYITPLTLALVIVLGWLHLSVVAGMLWRRPITGFTTGVVVAIAALCTRAPSLLLLAAMLASAGACGLRGFALGRHIRHKRAHLVYLLSGGRQTYDRYCHRRAREVRRIRISSPLLFRSPV